MFEHPFGHFSCVLVDINLVAPPIFNVLVERQGFDFFFYIEYENILIFYSICKFVSHSLDWCKRVNNELDINPSTTNAKNRKEKVYVLVSKDKLGNSSGL